MGEDEIQIPAVWVGGDEIPVRTVNQFLGQVDMSPGGEITLTMGMLTPPIVGGETPEERIEQARHIGFVPIHSVARVSLTPRRLDELIGVLQETKSNYEKILGEDS